MLCGVLTSLIWVYLPWYLSDLATSRDLVTNDTCGTRDADSDTEHWMTLLLGLNMGIQCFVGEVPMFFLSGWLIRYMVLWFKKTYRPLIGSFQDPGSL